MSYGTVGTVYTNDFRSSNLTYKGFSGGPIAEFANDNTNIVGVVNGSTNGGDTIGVRMTEEIISIISDLRGK